MLKVPKKGQPLVVKPSVRPIRYYRHVAKYMLNFLSNRTACIIVQKDFTANVITHIRLEDGTRAPIIINSEEELLNYVQKGALDFMASVKPTQKEVIDTLVLDVKGSKNVWYDEKCTLIFDLIVKTILAILDYLEIKSRIILFDGMNGFKVFAYLNPDTIYLKLQDEHKLLTSFV